MKNADTGEVVKEVPFSDITATMKKGDTFSQATIDLHLDKGKYQASVQMSIFSVDSSKYSIGTSPIFFKVE